MEFVKCMLQRYLVLLVPAEVGPVGELLRPLHHEVDEVSAATEAAGDEEVRQDPEEPAQVDVLVLLVLLLIHDGLLFSSAAETRFTVISSATTKQLVYLKVPHTCTYLSVAVGYLEAGGDGGVFVVSGL